MADFGRCCSTEGHALMFVTGIVLYRQNDLVGGRTGAV
jgi:hypothetical protein